MIGPTVSIVKWGEHQHYRNRDPSWVKLYRTMLTSEVWLLGTDDSRLVQVASVLLAARYQNAIPLHHSVWARVANLDISPERLTAAIAHLVKFGFLQHDEIIAENGGASAVLAECLQDAMLEKSRVEEKRGEERPAPARRSPSAKADRGTRLPADWTPEPVGAELMAECARAGVSLERELQQMRDWAAAASGSVAVKRDWQAAWRSWLRRACERGPRNAAPLKADPNDALERYRRRIEAAAAGSRS